VNVKASDFEVFEALAVDSVGTESAKTGELLPFVLPGTEDT